MHNRIASHRIASHRIASHRIASHLNKIYKLFYILMIPKFIIYFCIAFYQVNLNKFSLLINFQISYFSNLNIQICNK